MTKLTYTCHINAPLQQLWDFHESVEALNLLTPPGTKFTIQLPIEPACLGVKYSFKVVKNGIPMRWVAEYVEFDPPNGFADLQIKGPFKFWKHTHRFAAVDGGSQLTDILELDPGFGFLGMLALKLFIRRDIDKMFAYRHKVMKEYLESRQST
ncbi:MAG: SRPBCC family protein [Chthonomonadales bacterium]